MVTKHVYPPMNYYISLILAKNHMVTKLYCISLCTLSSLILAKNHMVTKLVSYQ